MARDDATEVLTLRNAGERFGLSPTTLRAMAQRGELARAYKRPCDGGEEWVVPVLTVEALAAAGQVRHPVPPLPYAAESTRRRGAKGTLGIVLGALALAVALVALVAALGDDGEAPASPDTTTDLPEATRLVGVALDDALDPGAAVGVLGTRAAALAGERPTVALPADELPDVVVVAGTIPTPAVDLVEEIRSQGTLILTLSGLAGGGEVWQLPEVFSPPAEGAAPPATPAPPVVEGSGGPATPATPATPGATAVVTVGEGFWHVAEAALGDQLGRAPTDAEVLPYWQALIDANLDQLPDPGNPDLLYAGTVLVLPGT